MAQQALSLLCLTLWLGVAGAVTINVGVVMRYTGGNSAWGFARTAAGISLGLEEYQRRTGHLTEHTFRMVILHDPCQPGRTIATVSESYYSDSDKPDVVFGASCSFVLVPLGRYLSYWKIPFFATGGTDPRLTDKDVYSTLVRIHPSGDKMAKAFTNIFRKYGWKRTAMVTSYGFCDLTAVGIYPALTDMGVTITEWIRPPKEGVENFQLEQYVDQITERARVIIVCFDNDLNLLDFLRIAHKKGMTSPDYVMFNYLIGGVDEGVSKPWTFDTSLNEAEIQEWKSMLVQLNLKQVIMAGLRGQKIEDFYDLMPVRFTQPPWNFNLSLEMGYRGSFKGVDVHDTALAYFEVFDELITQGKDYRDGDLIRNMVRNRIINGLRGKILFDDNADRIPDFWILDLHSGWDQYREVTLIIVAEEEGKRFVPLDNQTLLWGTVGNLPPPDTPVCGFQNELCADETSGDLFITVGLGTGGIIVLTIVVLSIIMYRRQKEEEALQQTVWKVDFSEIRIGKLRPGSVANMSQRRLSSPGSADDGVDDLGIRKMFTEVGTYRGNVVAILRVNKSHVDLTKDDMKELKAMKDMSHMNLAMFVGACTDPPNICHIMDYYTKGSLQDIIENEIIGLDWMFKTSLLSDLANGMAYLHKSELQSHGSLKSTCCLVDSRWQLKVSSYGLHAFRTGQDGSNIGEHEKYRKLLWTAPELLRIPKKDWPRYGTQAGDVYSFAIISKVARGNPSPYRPELLKMDENTPPDAVRLVRECWVEDATARPTFENILKLIRTINADQEVDIMASMIGKLEKYANNLEDIVNQRSSELVVEKKRTDKLLESMLPPSVVEELKHGRTVDAELFEAVTIFFSDIVGFTALSLESSPIDIIDLLNDLYTLFDDIISLHDVYKVETISDSYMVVSGLPRRNGDNHVGEIANLALDLMSAALEFKIRHRPSLKLKLRIGFHTGPCAAGVVGLSMPRYCLFGDTVNMASRMETNGKALMIHMSRYAFAALQKLQGYTTQPRGEMQIKGKGLQMTYWLLGKDGFNKPLPPFDE